MRGAVRWLPALLVPVVALWVVAAAGVGVTGRVAVITVALAALLVALGVWQGLPLDATHGWLAGLLAWAALVAAVRPVAHADAMWLLAVGAVALAFLAAAARPRVAAWAAIAVVLAGTLGAAWLVVERVLLGPRPPGPFGNPNPAASLAVLALALVPWLRAPRYLRLVAGSIAAAGIVSSGSRSALLAMAVIALAWVGSRRLRLVALAIAGLAIAGISLRVATDRDPLRWERVRIWSTAIRTAIAELPCGAGPGGFADAAVAHNFPRVGEFAHFHRLPSLAESDLLQLAATLGIPGLVLGLGLTWRVVAVLLAAGSRGRAVAGALLVGAAFNSHLALPVMAWTTALAVAGARGRLRARPLRAPASAVMAAILLVAVPAALALAERDGGIARDAERVVSALEVELPVVMNDDNALARLEARAEEACKLRPRLGRAWRVLGVIQLRRADLRREDALVEAAVASYRRGRAVNPTDVWAAAGEARSLRRRGDLAGARRALLDAVRLEPNCAVAWQELGAVHLAAGELRSAREALARLETALLGAGRATFVSSYERAMVAVDDGLVRRLREAVGLRP